MRETLELLEDLLSESDQGDALDIKYTDQIEMAVCAYINAAKPALGSAEHTGGQMPYDFTLNGKKWEIKQFSSPGVLARLGSAKTSELLSLPEIVDIMNVCKVVDSNIDVLSTIRLVDKTAIEWMTTKVGEKTFVSRLSEMNITTDMMDGIKSNKFKSSLQSIREGIAGYINLPDPEDPSKIEILTRPEGSEDPPEPEGIVSKKEYTLAVAPIMRTARKITSDKKLNSAIAAFRSVDDFLQKYNEQSFDDQFWSSVLLKIAGLGDDGGFVGLDFIDVSSIPSKDGIPTFSVSIRDVTMYTMGQLTISVIDTGRPVPKAMTQGVGVKVPFTPGAEYVGENSKGVTIRVIPEAELVSTTRSQAVNRIIRDMSKFLDPGTGAEKETEAKSLIQKLNSVKPDAVTPSMVKELVDVFQSHSQSTSLKQNKIVNDEIDNLLALSNMKGFQGKKGEKQTAKDAIYKFINSVVKHYQERVGYTGLGGSSEDSSLNSGRLRPGPLVSETLTLLEDLLTP